MKEKNLRVAVWFGIGLFVALIFGIGHWEKQRWASANISVVDNNGYSIPYAMASLRSLNGDDAYKDTILNDRVGN